MNNKQEQVRIYLDQANIKYIKLKGSLSKVINDLVTRLREDDNDQRNTQKG